MENKNLITSDKKLCVSHIIFHIAIYIIAGMLFLLWYWKYLSNIDKHFYPMKINGNVFLFNRYAAIWTIFAWTSIFGLMFAIKNIYNIKLFIGLSLFWEFLYAVYDNYGYMLFPNYYNLYFRTNEFFWVLGLLIPFIIIFIPYNINFKKKSRKFVPVSIEVLSKDYTISIYSLIVFIINLSFLYIYDLYKYDFAHFYR